MIDRQVSHYVITAALGAGGMGEVYRATDLKLGREVALKILPADVAADPERTERFQREARAVAALNHPGIVTIYSVEETDGLHFLTMELVEGQSLDRLIPKGGLEVERIAAIGQALGSALAAAHDKGIIHRDLKPANVMITPDGAVKVLDFGLAKVLEPDTGHEAESATALLTAAGVVMGTRPYMSPEQIQGRPVDCRTDIFSLGVMLYEMATGHQPFRGPSSADLFASILRDSAPLVSDVRVGLPADLARVIARCLAKHPNDRIQSAREIGDQLRAGSLASPPRADAGSNRPDSGQARADEGFWIAVLPFRASGPDGAVAVLADGMSEEIVTALSRFPYLRVIARSSTSRYAGEAADVRAVGQTLGARYVMEGSLRQAGSALRATVQLIDADTGAHLWAETYHRSFDAAEVFALQDDLVPRIVSTIADAYGVLPHSMSEGLRSRDPKTLSPHEASLRGLGYYERMTEAEHAEVRDALELAVRKAPSNADCLALLSQLYIDEHRHGFNPRPDPLGRSLDTARRAVAAGPSNNIAYYSLAQALFFRREFQAFKNAADRAVALNPADGLTSAFMGILTAYAGDWDRGCTMVERAIELNPHAPGWYRFALSFNAFRRKDYRTALDFALKINTPTYFFTHGAIAAACGKLGERAAAQGALQELLALKPDFATEARQEYEKWFGPGELLEDILDGLRKAGLAVP